MSRTSMARAPASSNAPIRFAIRIRIRSRVSGGERNARDPLQNRSRGARGIAQTGARDDHGLFEGKPSAENGVRNHVREHQPGGTWGQVEPIFPAVFLIFAVILKPVVK